jgi:hypothetical protein
LILRIEVAYAAEQPSSESQALEDFLVIASISDLLSGKGNEKAGQGRRPCLRA